MTHQNHQTNGASLEDCHTNFFSLTELFGIKWRKLVWGETTGGGEGEEGAAPLADPVISSYARCLAGDILCVWRRVPAPPTDVYDMTPPVPPPLSLKAAKELWIFWYGEEPDLSGLVAPELISSQGDQGSWESGLSYECRSLLFKALHNLIERCLLSRDFVRLGKWFVQPYDGDEEDIDKSPWHLSFSFAFFLHGESTVCASVDVRQHPPVRTLTARRLARLRGSGGLGGSGGGSGSGSGGTEGDDEDDKVILAPFGLEGRVTGREWSDTDPGTARLLDAWRQLYPLEKGCGAVEVVWGGVSLRYPLPYTLRAPLRSPRPPAPPPPPPAPAPQPHDQGHPHAVARGLADNAARALTTPMPHLPAEICFGDAANEKGDDFNDPTRKALCTCAKWRRRRAARPPPFHRRRLRDQHAHHRPAGACAGVGACSPGSCGGASPAPAVSAPSSAGAPHVSPHHTTCTTHQLGASVPTTLHTPAPTPDPLAPPTPAPPPPPATKYTQGSPGGSGGSAGGASPGSGWRRPQLPAPPPPPDPADTDNHLTMLYDYSTVRAWLDHPVVRCKGADNSLREEAAQSPADLYAGHQHTKMAAGPDYNAMASVKQEHNEDVKEHKNLFTSDGLCPTYKDLDQIFENSDDAASGDETVRLLQVSTPPDSNKSTEERCLGRCVRAEELSQMFPTPPSLEAHAQPSPGFTLVDDTPTPLRPPPAPGSPTPDPIDDWSYVFRPPTVYKYVGSSKYAPLTALPSALLPPLALPPTAVYRPRWQPSPPTPSPSPAPPRAPKRPASPPSPAPRARRPVPPPSLPPHRPEPRRRACPLLLNVLMADTVLNVFRDHNFDSCTLCVCNAGPRVGNIRGADAAAYLRPGEDSPRSSPPPDDEPSRCTCGFSAILNRRLAHRAGLFYEDEMEITGLAEEPPAQNGRRGLAEVASLVLAATGAGGGPASALSRAARRTAEPAPPDDLRLNLLEYSDGGAAAARALRAAAPAQPRPQPSVHRWPFIVARAPRSSRDVVRLMRRLRPLLQDAIQKRCCGARMWDGVSGPLTWRQFHRLAGRGNEDLCEPQPVPPLMVGHDRDWVSLSPYALRHWERLALEPYSYSRDVAFVALAPDGETVTERTRTFFRELAATYEACRLGRHRSLGRMAREGLVRAAAAEAAAHDEWAGELPPGRAGAYLRGYGEALRALVPQLAALTVDRSLLEADRGGEEEAAPAPPQWPAEDDEAGAVQLVIYLVEPPAAHAHHDHTLHALLRLAARVHHHLHHHNPLIKIISLEGVCETWSGGGEVRALAFSVFTGARRLLVHQPNGKSLTGFGTAANANLFLTNKDEKNRAAYALYSPAWVLAPPRALKEVAETWGTGGTDTSAVLFVAYCLSHDQRWLLAAATDARGELLDTAVINIHVPARSRRRRSAAARRLGLTKLMDFTLGVMSQTAQPWRLVVGRVGRIGHGELKGWSWLLSRKNLVRASSVLREICAGCGAVYPAGSPCIVSACLVSTEPDSCLRLMADRFTPDERFSQASIQSHLHTPRDVTATHILVFPTSATTQSNQVPFEPSMANGEDNDMMFLGVDMADEDMGEDNIGELLIGDMFMWANSPPRGSPRRDNDDAGDGSPARHHPAPAGQDHTAEQVLQQPLALGYMVSTAPLGGMPAWWWAGCAHLRGACPAFVKTALHLHAGSLQVNDDLAALTQRRDRNAHPLDSQITTDVLRYVLEGYNALSWLALDGGTHDRLSCLPLHVQVLMELYHTAAALG